jgi:hypothetical protein
VRAIGRIGQRVSWGRRGAACIIVDVMISSFLNARRVRVIDICLVVWIVVWTALGILIAIEINKVTRLADTAVATTTALQQTTEGLKVVADVPIIGASLGQVVDQVDALAQKAKDDAVATRTSIRIVAVLSGIGIAVAPSLIVLLFYLPWRLPWGRDVRAVRQGLLRDPNDSALDAYLARRAITWMTWDEARELSADPWQAIAAGEARAFADRELARLGLRRS